MTKNCAFIKALENTEIILRDVLFLVKSRLKATYFTRKSKMNFIDLMMFIINFTKNTLQIELDNFMEDIKGKDMIYTKQAFSKARQKISPWAFIHIFKENVKLFYTATDLSTYKGYRLLAIDGSTSELPVNTQELRDYFGFAQNGKEDVAMARVSGLYDIENDVLVDALITRYDTDERTLATKHIEALKEYGLQNDLVLFDRGYPSRDLIAYMYENGVNFLMRVSGSFIKEVNNVKENEEVVEYRYEGKIYKLRVLKITLKTGEIETLISSIMDKSFTTEDFKALYLKRWSIEVKYNIIKNRLQMENYTGEMPIAIEQDFYATAYLTNMAAFAKMAADDEIQERNEENNLKYEYKTNVNILVGKLKNKLVLMMLESNEKKRLKILRKIMDQIARNVIPIRPERQNPRRKKFIRDKYPVNGKCSL